MERAVEVFAAVQFLVIGLSHLFQPRVWVEFFTWLRGKGYAGVFVNGFLSLGFGAFIVAFHNVWTGLPMILTLIGWAQIIKAIRGLRPASIGMRGFQRVAPERAGEFRVGGVVFLALAALMAYLVVRR